MGSNSKDDRMESDQALELKDYSSAIQKLESYLKDHPDDVESRLELGLIYLLHGDRGRFEQCYERLSEQLEKRPPLEPRARTLWDRYRTLAGSMAKAAAILTLAGLPITGCASSSTGSGENQPTPASIGTQEHPVSTPNTEADETSGTDGSVENPDAAIAGDPNQDGNGSSDRQTSDSGTASSTSEGGAASPEQPEVQQARPHHDHSRPMTRYIVARPRSVPDLNDSE